MFEAGNRQEDSLRLGCFNAGVLYYTVRHVAVETLVSEDVGAICGKYAAHDVFESTHSSI
jgi:hypothetical protein